MSKPTVHLTLNITGPDWAWAVLSAAAAFYAIAAVVHAALSLRLAILKRRAVNSAIAKNAR